MIKTWQQRCEDHEGIVNHQMILERMQEEIDELRQALAQPVDLAKVGEVGVWGENREWVGLTDQEIWDLGADHAIDLAWAREIEAKLKEKNA